MILRLLRLTRILRLIKVLKAFKVVETLLLITKSIQSSFIALVWSFTLLWSLQVTVGIVLCQGLAGFLNDDSKPLDTRQEAFRYFGTVPNAIVTMFEITLWNWAVTCRFFYEQVNAWFGAFYILYRCCFLFAVMNVITAVFIAETNRVAASDDELAITKKQRQKEAYCSKLKDVFTELDVSHDGYVSREEFAPLVRDELMTTWLATLEIDTLDLTHVFHMLAGDDDKFNLNEFTSCLSRVKGPAKSVDLLKVITVVGKIERKLDNFCKQNQVAKHSGVCVDQASRQLEVLLKISSQMKGEIETLREMSAQTKTQIEVLMKMSTEVFSDLGQCYRRRKL